MADARKKRKQAPKPETEEAWKYLQRALPPELLNAPLIKWNEVAPEFIRYLYKHARGTPWLKQLAFMIAVLTGYARLDRQSIRNRLSSLQARFRLLFPKYKIASFEKWNPNEHVPRYLSDPDILDSFVTRQQFLGRYVSTTNHLMAYLRALPQASRQVYQRWVIPPLPLDLQKIISEGGVMLAEQRQRRKEETDALAPHFARIRGAAHLRWNQLNRLREKYREAVALAQSGKETLPLIFSYEEPSLKQRFVFRLWDRYSFTKAYIDQYDRGTRDKHTRKIGGFSPENNHFFMEYVRAESLTEGTCDPDALLWFGDLFRYNLFGQNPNRGSEEERRRKQDYLRSWGHGEEGSDEAKSPFNTFTSGLLTMSHSQGNYLSHAQNRCKGILFMIEPLFAAATFGLAALDFFTTTGARIGELLQLSLDPDCLYTLEIEGNPRFLVRLIPKGRDKPADYVVGTETLRNLEKVGDLLREHYQIQPGACLPSVPFTTRSGKAHRFPKSRPYLFQYGEQHLPEAAINACMRFLCHGLVFQTADGKVVTLKAHALRHAFATHIHQTEGIPLDIVAVMLHQKNVQVTAYYAAPPWQQVLVIANSLLDKFATHLGSLEEAFVRSPAEMQRQLEEAKVIVGTLATVVGGECTCHAICPISFACTGCVYKVPNPDREDEIIEQEQWAFIRLEQVKRRKLGPEIVKMEALIQRCKTEREEMRLMRAWREDEAYAATITIERRDEGDSSLVEEVS